MQDISEKIDDYCRERFGHTNWGYLSSYEEHELEHAQKCGQEYEVENGIVYWLNDFINEGNNEKI